MEGNMFFWFAWMLWLIPTFFMEKDNNNRSKYASFLLIAIILYPHQLPFMGMEVSVLLLVQIVSAFIYAARLRTSQQLYMVLTAFMTMLAYCALQLLSILDPVWLLIDKDVMLAVMLAILSVMLHRTMATQGLMIIIGSSVGEMLYGYLLHYYRMDERIGTAAFFDSLLLCIASITAWNIAKVFLAKLEQQIYLIEKEKQKL
ncbi:MULTISPECIES: YphA family membrane protein [Bacillaceae]|uniref:YphA family membrane protein n=1 Tax=Bacillaceae TaxID=186817 RepID=UPI001E3A9539|nr:hypothetical protein [Bacillus sp. Au-Bac7]MCE4047203.1 hypothetical protein [Bacillus sp. Au-Bac7]